MKNKEALPGHVHQKEINSEGDGKVDRMKG